MGNVQNPAAETKLGTGESNEPVTQEVTKPTDKKPACKACCACPETKRARDQCIMERGEENCKELIEAHKKCMREQGFNV